MNINHRIKAKTELEATFIEAMEVGCKIILDTLKIENVDIQCQRQAGWAGADANHAGMFESAKYNKFGIIKGFVPLIKINFRNLSGFNLLQYVKVLAHEARHAYQYKNEWIKPFDKTWKGENLLNASVEPNMTGSFKFDSYINSKHEIDARNYENIYSKIILDHPDFKKFLKYIDETIGDKVIIKDFEKTYQIAKNESKIKGDDSPIQLFTIDNITYWVNLSSVSTRAKNWSKAQINKVWKESSNYLVNKIEISSRELTSVDFI